MATFRTAVRTQLAPGDAWARLVSADAHTAAVPLTTVTCPGGSFGVPGTRLVARTGVGPVGFDDPMVVDAADGRTLRLHKTGRVVRGDVHARVTPAATGSVVVWDMRIAVAGVPRALDPVVAVVARLAYRAALRRVLAG